ncbi:MAG: hypothetical protein ACLUOI_14860 [Eisenbergiella sp.]
MKLLKEKLRLPYAGVWKVLTETGVSPVTDQEMAVVMLRRQRR